MLAPVQQLIGTHAPLRCAMQVAFVGLTEEAAREKAQKEGWAEKLAVSKTAFKANSKALAETEGDGIAKMIYRWGGMPATMHVGWLAGRLGLLAPFQSLRRGCIAFVIFSRTLLQQVPSCRLPWLYFTQLPSKPFQACR